MKYKIKSHYYLQNLGISIIWLLFLWFGKFNWFMKVIVVQLLVFAIVDIFNMACYYYVDDDGITLYSLNRKKHINWNSTLGIMKNSSNNKDSQLIIIDTNNYIKINNSINDFTTFVKLVDEKVKKYNIETDTALIARKLPNLYGSYLYSFMFSMVLTSVSIIIALVTQMLAFSDLIDIGSVMKLLVIFLFSNMIVIRFLHQKI